MQMLSYSIPCHCKELLAYFALCAVEDVKNAGQKNCGTFILL